MFFLNQQDYEKGFKALQIMLWPSGSSQAEEDSANATYGRLPQGEGLLVIREMRLDSLGAGRRPCFAGVRFDVELRWPPRSPVTSAPMPR